MACLALSNSCIFFKFVNGILRNWESLCDIRPDCHHHFDAMLAELQTGCLTSEPKGL